MADSSLAPFDRALADRALLQIRVESGQGQPIPFQFAPRIISESNSTLWQEQNMTSFAPLYLLMGAAGRKMNVEWEYIATDSTFSGDFIANILRTLKSYFYRFHTFNKPPYALVSFKHTQILPELVDFRMHDLNISYGQEIVASNNLSYPLYTKVAIALSLATTLGGRQKITPLKDVKAEWY